MSIAPSQILYLEHGHSRLYAEAIQIVAPRRLCWARPTLLIQGLPAESSAAERQQIIAAAALEQSHIGLELYDLKDAPDLIWPQSLFEIAYDLDFFALLIQLKISPDEAAQRSGPQQLNRFLHSFWQSRPHVFPPTPHEDGRAARHYDSIHRDPNPRDPNPCELSAIVPVAKAAVEKPL